MGEIIFNKKGNDHYTAILNDALNADKILIVSPYCYPDFTKFFSDVTTNNSLKSISFITTLKDDEAITKAPSLQSFLLAADKYGTEAKISIMENLHAKIYMFYKNGHPISAIITSANITENGLRRNYECGYRTSDTNTIDNIEQDLQNMEVVELTSDKLDAILHRIAEYKSKNNIDTTNQNTPSIYVDDLLYVDYVKNNIFLKPIGCTEHKVFSGDFSTVDEERFSKRKPRAVRPGDILIVYAVGSAKIVSVYEVVSEAYYKDVGDRWPWHVQVRNLTPAFGKIWYTRNLFPTRLANEYVNNTGGLPVTYAGGKNLKSLNYGLDKLKLAPDFGKFLMNRVFEENSRA